MILQELRLDRLDDREDIHYCQELKSKSHQLFIPACFQLMFSCLRLSEEFFTIHCELSNHLLLEQHQPWSHSFECTQELIQIG